MKKLIYTSAFCFALSILLSFGFSQTPKTADSKGNVITVKTEKQIKKVVIAKAAYTCPMHSKVVQNTLGKCPKCGMNLVKKEVPKKTLQKKCSLII